MADFSRSEGFPAGLNYEQIMKNTLKSRTGKNFEANIDAAPPPPKIQKMGKEEGISLILENIVNKHEQRKQPPEPDVSAAAYYGSDSAVISEEALTHQSATEIQSDSDLPTVTQTLSEADAEALARQYAAELDDLLGF
ncbi:MAG: hypothetical protein IGS03_01450 [Candidatus Sericytochromatia bacterium]|nr:hypothetical protein [Candidatus Sericytochromatia bacterium]